MTRASGECGTSLVELLVVVVVFGVVSQLVLTMLISVYRTSSRATAERVGGDDAQAAVERLTRDLRMVRTVDAATPTSVTAWLDADDDFARDPGETVTWAWAPAAAGAPPRLARTNDTGGTQVVAASSIVGVSFTYLPSVATATSVQAVVTYRMSVRGDVTQRTLTTLVRLRNRP